VADLREQLQNGLTDRYRLDRELGRGGMATVFLAHDLRHKRPVALKVLHPELAHTLGPERFQREIETVARLQHPHILTVHDSGETAGQLWFTMPFVEGESLRDRLRREQQLPVDVAIRIATDAARALQYAHDHGVIHRDIKPENLLLTKDGSTLVADFGLAKALRVGDDRLTETGLSVGTPTYMSPEQAAGDPHLDARTDVYALGTVLYEMLVGEPPFTGRTAQVVIAKRLSGEVPRVRHVRPTVPQGVEEAVIRALAVVAADRFASAAEFARVLLQPLSTPATTNTLEAPQPTAVGGRWRMSRGLATLALGVLVGVGVLLAWLRARPEPGATGPKRLAVLPFENLGRPEDQYFADGLTDEVRGKLAGLPGLEVIARASSSEYKQTTKRPQQIGRELGVDYLLTGTVRWEKNADGPSRVRVSPELVQVSTASSKWQAPFEVPLTDVFRVQADVAARVAEALGLALGTSERERLGERPTENLAAYDAFLKGEGTTDGLITGDWAALRTAIGYYERAVALDSTFMLAWAQLSRAHSSIYGLSPNPLSGEAEAARKAAERALALARIRPEGYLALGDYYGYILLDLAGALEQYTKGLQLAPKDTRLLNAVAGCNEGLGQVDKALELLQAATALDPRSVEISENLVYAFVRLRRDDQALAAAERARALAPANLRIIGANVIVHLARGDLSGARGVIREVPREVDPTALVAYLATFDDLHWVLDDEQQRLLLRLTPEQFGGSFAAWGLALAETYALRGDTASARIYADSARLAFENRLRFGRQEAWAHVYLGLALGFMGRKGDAVREGERGVVLWPKEKNPGLAADLRRVLAWTYLIVGEQEKALDQIESLLRVPSYWVSPGWLKIDPNFAPLRGNPRFERLLRGT
jgi:serine/threonine-protein kinase